jgi:hypothetical protein
MRMTIHLERPDAVNPFRHNTTRNKRSLWEEVMVALKGVTRGGGTTGRRASRPTAWGGITPAVGTVTCASAAAADTVSINGVAITAVSGAPAADQFDVSGSDIADATSLALGIRSSVTALVSNHVKATNLSGTITAATVLAGDTVTIDGVALRAKASGATVRPKEFSVGASNSACATNLAAAINADPYLSTKFYASAAAAVVTLHQLESTTARLLASSSGSRLAVVAIAATAVVLVWSLYLGNVGNIVTLASSNGGRLAVSGARLTGGTQTNFTF